MYILFSVIQGFEQSYLWFCICSGGHMCAMDMPANSMYRLCREYIDINCIKLKVKDLVGLNIEWQIPFDMDK